MKNFFIVRCSICGSKNRIFLEKINSIPRCGKCKLEIMIPNRAISINANDFKKEVLEETIPTAVDFWAPWCQPCKIVSPILEDIAKNYMGKIKIVKMNSDDNHKLSSLFEIQGIPTILFFMDGKEVDRLVGVAPKEHILKFLHIQ